MQKSEPIQPKTGTAALSVDFSHDYRVQLPRGLGLRVGDSRAAADDILSVVLESGAELPDVLLCLLPQIIADEQFINSL